MTPGAWILLASLLTALAFGVWRAYADGRFRGTHEIRQSTPEGSRQGRPTSPEESRPTSHEDDSSEAASLLPPDQLGERVTLLQFSSAFCAPCRATRRVLADVADVVPGVTHVEVDAEQRLDLVRRVDVRRTPTTLVLDAAGREVTRASGAPRKEQVLAAVESALESSSDGGQTSHDAGNGHV